MPPAEKLIRDKLDAVIPAGELRIETSRVLLFGFLETKLGEELAELRETDFSDAGEFADVMEVLLALASAKGIGAGEIETARKKKLEARGGFSRGLIWQDPEQRRAAHNIPVPEAGELHAYADGGCAPNPGAGGWGMVSVGSDGEMVVESGAEQNSTNNRMELEAAAAAVRLSAREGITSLVVHVDSTYVRDGVKGWIKGWKRNGWKTASGTPVKNRDLWEQLDAQLVSAAARKVNVRFDWVKGHAGNAGNTAADEAATAAREKMLKDIR